MSVDIFSSNKRTTLTALTQPSAEEAKKLMPLSIQLACFATVALAVTLFEAHIVYATFEYAFGQDDKVFKPWLMSMASLILVLAVHFMAHKNPNHLVVTFINRSAGSFIPVYLLGIGTLVVVTLYNGNIGDMLEAGKPLVIDDNFGTEEPAGSWLKEFMYAVVSPLAGALFSLGIGSLAVVSVFVAHHALTKTEARFAEFSRIFTAYRQDQRDLKRYTDRHEAYEAEQTHIDDLMINDENAITGHIADEVMLIKHDEVEPYLRQVNDAKYIASANKQLLPPNQANIDALEKALKPILAITRDDVIDAMNA